MCDINGYSNSGLLHLSTELNILIDEWKIFYYCKGAVLCLYISKNEINPPFHDNIMLDPNIVLGFIEAKLINYNDPTIENDLNIRMLRANVKRQGIGIYLFLVLAYICKNIGIKDINLENMSGIDDYYSNIGCEYDEIGLPEMTCLVSNVLKKINLFKQKYQSQKINMFFKPNRDIYKDFSTIKKTKTRSIINKKK